MSASMVMIRSPTFLSFAIFRLDIESDEGDWLDYFAIPMVFGSNRPTSPETGAQNEETVTNIEKGSSLNDKPLVYPNPLLEQSNLPHLVLAREGFV